MSEDMNEQIFEMLMKRFDTLESQNEVQLDLLRDHVTTDNTVHAVVAQHATYWSILKWIAASGVGIAASVAGFFGFHKP